MAKHNSSMQQAVDRAFYGAANIESLGKLMVVAGTVPAKDVAIVVATIRSWLPTLIMANGGKGETTYGSNNGTGEGVKSASASARVEFDKLLQAVKK